MNPKKKILFFPFDFYSHFLRCFQLADAVREDFDVYFASSLSPQTNAAVLEAWIRHEPLVSWVAPRAGTTALLRFQREQESESFCRELFDATGVMLVPGACFEFSDCSARMGFAPRTEILRGGLEALGTFLHA